MRVSVVTISFNQAEFLERTLTSVLGQSYSDIEYIVVDAGSSDASREIIDRYRDRLAHVIYEPDNGPADGLNKGFSRATGELFFFLNSDDTIDKSAIGSAVAHFEKNSTASVVYGHGYFIDAFDTKIRRARSDRFELRHFGRGEVFILQQSTFVRGRDFRGIGGFNPANKTCWDAELIADLSISGKRVVRANEYWGNFRLHPQSITGSATNAIAYGNDRRRIFSKVFGRMPTRWDLRRDRFGRVLKWIRNPDNLFYRLSEIALRRMKLR